MKRFRILITSVLLASALPFPAAASRSIPPQTASGQTEPVRPGIGAVIEKVLAEKGAAAAIEHYKKLKSGGPGAFNFAEGQLNALGYRLMQRNQGREALAILLFNAECFPESTNALDSVAEAHLNLGDVDQAVKFYRAALAKEPGFAASALGLQRIEIIRNYDKKEYRIPMRDGAALFTQVYSPLDASKKYPILLNRTPYTVVPYGTEKLAYRNPLGPSAAFARDGYIFVYQDVRGKHMSEGEYVDVRPYRPRKKGPSDIDESSDTYDTIDWLIKNVPNNNGRAGIWGISYPGFYSSMALLDPHPALAAASPQAPIGDWFIDDDFHRNGAFHYLQAVNFMRGWAPRSELIRAPTPRVLTYPVLNLYDFLLSVGPVSNIEAGYFKSRVPFWNQMMEHGVYDDFWKERNILPHLKNIKPAVLMVGGWFDAEDLYGTMKTYAAIERNSPGVRNNLVMGPWYHAGWGGQGPENLGDIPVFAASTGRYFQENVLLAFFRKHLKGEGALDIPEALVYETGANAWRSYDSWPPAEAVKKSLYLRADHALSFAAPEAAESGSFSEYVSDPEKPVPHKGEPILGWGYDFMHADQRYAASRPDVLVFQTEPLRETVTLAGPLRAELVVSTTGTDSDWIVKVIDVYPDNARNPVPNPRGVVMGGYQMLVRGEIMRGKFREGFDAPRPFVPSRPTRVGFELQDINHAFLPGHRIMVQVHSTWFPLFDRNPQKFMDIYKAGPDDFQKALHRVYHSPESPSRVEVLVVPSK